jgi:hypothetical protein
MSTTDEWKVSGQQDPGDSLICEGSDGEPSAPELVEKSSFKTSLSHRCVDDLLRSSQPRVARHVEYLLETMSLLVQRHLSLNLTEYEVEDGISIWINEGGGTPADKKRSDGSTKKS